MTIQQSLRAHADDKNLYRMGSLRSALLEAAARIDWLETVSVEVRLSALRSAGWMVAVHNDYRLNGEPMTFWLFTHPDGRWVKGEGRTDNAALALAHAAAERLPA